MPISSLFIGAKGITEHQKAVTVIANNISNVNSVAFKKSAVTFKDSVGNLLKPGTAASTRIGGTNPIEMGTGVSLNTVSTVFDQGAVRSTGSPLNLAINGDGFFVISTSTVQEEGLSNSLYSRDGNFSLDSAGNLVNATGQKIMGATFYDETTSEIKSVGGYTNISYYSDQDIGDENAPSVVGNDFVTTPPAPTLTPASPASPVPVFNLNNIAELSVRGNVINENNSVDTAAPGDFSVSKNAFGNLVFRYEEGADTFEYEFDPSIPLGNVVNSFALSDVAGTGEQVQLRIRVKPGIVRMEDVFSNLVYDDVAAAGSTIDFPGAHPSVQSGNDMTVGEPDVQFLATADLDNLYDPIRVPPFFYSVDSSAENSVTDVSIATDGSIAILGPSSERMNVGRVLMANFRNYDGLVNKGNNMYEVSPNSGNPAYSVIGGPAENNAPELNATQLISGALEMANVDIAAEFSDLIAYQRGLQASARTVSISDEILQSIINI